MSELDTAEYLEELAQALASHGSNLAALRMAELEQKVSPYLAAPGVPTATVGGGGSLAGVDTAYAPTVAMGSAGLFITDGAITVTNPGSTVIIDGTSNMFKIVATGTVSVAFPGYYPAEASAYTTLTGLGSGYSTSPAIHFNTSRGATGPGIRGPEPVELSGTSVPSGMWWGWGTIISGVLRVGVTASCSGNVLSGSAYCRYYVFKEEGI